MERARNVDLDIPGGWTEKTIEVGGRQLSIILPADADQFLDHLDRDQLPLHVADPYWARLWPTAITMADIVARENWLGPQDTLELGCGIGIVGLAGLVRGLQITFSDYVPLAVDLACENARRNGFADFSGCVLDWNRPPSRSFSRILASDVLYDPKSHDTLLNVLEFMLAPKGETWIGDPGRFHCEGFVHAAERRGYVVSIFDEHRQPLQRVKAGSFCLLVLRKYTSFPRVARP